jgi:hypothetical protein
MASLTGQTIASSFDSLLKLTDNGPITSDLKLITDGLGNSTSLSLSSLGASIGGTLAVSSTLSASNFSGTFNGTFSGTSSNTNTGDETNATIKSKLGFATTSVDGYLKSTDWNTFNNKVATTRSISTSAPLSGGGDLSANRTLTISQATTSTDGYLSSTDWDTFNDKIGGAGVGNYIPKFTDTTIINNSQIYDNGTNIGIGTTSPSSKLSVNGSGFFSGELTTNGFFTAGTGLSVSGGPSYLNGTAFIGSLGDGDYRLRTDGGNVYILGELIVSNGEQSLTYNLSGLTIGGLPITNATNISGSGKLTITDIGAGGTLNVGSTTTATKRLEVTGNNNGNTENNTLRFVDTDTTSAIDQVIGKIEFYSGDISSPGAGVKAYISASARTTSPQGYLDFATDELTGTPSIRQRIQADGKVLIGSTTDNTSGNLLQVNGGLDYNIGIKPTASTAYTLALIDKGKYFRFNATTAIAVTIPTNASVPFPIGTQMWFYQVNLNGIPTFSGDTGVTLRTRSTTRQPFGQYAEVKLTKIAEDEWVLSGDLKA